MGELEGTYRVLQTPGARLGTATPVGVSTLEPGQGPPARAARPAARTHIRVQLLDDSVEVFDIEPKCDGQALLTQVWERLNLIECDYFGLESQNAQSCWIWLEPMKPIIRQVRRPKNAVLRLAVKFFPPDPGQLQEEYTRYLFALQLKRDLLEERLTCTDTTAALLASHLLQAEVGDYDETLDREHLRAHEYVPRQERALHRILAFHRELASGVQGGVTCATALSSSSLRRGPGVSHRGLLRVWSGSTGFQTSLGQSFVTWACPARLLLRLSCLGSKSRVRGCARRSPAEPSVPAGSSTRINTFNWSRLRKLSFKRKRFLIKLHPEVHGPYQDTLEFVLGSRDECKNFWKICVEHHTFFRLLDQPKPKAKAVLFSRGSSFRYSGRTQKQLADYVKDGGMKRVPYERRHSKTQTSLRALKVDLPRQSIAFSEGVRTPVTPSPTTASFCSAPASPPVPPGSRDFQVGSGSSETGPPAPGAWRPAAERSSMATAQPLRLPALQPHQGAGFGWGAKSCGPRSPEGRSCPTSGPDSGGAGRGHPAAGRGDRSEGPLTGGSSSRGGHLCSPPGHGGGPVFTLTSAQLQVSEEFIDDDPADISFFAGGSEAFSFPYGGLSPGSGPSSPEGSSPEVAPRDGGCGFEFEEGSLGDAHPLDTSELLEVKAQASLMQRLLSPSDTSSLRNNQSEASSLSNAPLPSSLSAHMPGSAPPSGGSSMANFPACSVRSEASSAFQFSDIVDQLEQLSYPPTAAEDSSSSDTDSWGSEAAVPLDVSLFFSSPFAQARADRVIFDLQNNVKNLIPGERIDENLRMLDTAAPVLTEPTPDAVLRPGRACVWTGVGTVRQPLLPCRCFACALLLGARPCLGFRGRSLPSVLMLARPAAQMRVPCVPVPSRVTRIPAALLPGCGGARGRASLTPGQSSCLPASSPGAAFCMNASTSPGAAGPTLASDCLTVAARDDSPQEASGEPLAFLSSPAQACCGPVVSTQLDAPHPIQSLGRTPASRAAAPGGRLRRVPGSAGLGEGRLLCGVWGHLAPSVVGVVGRLAALDRPPLAHAPREPAGLAWSVPSVSGRERKSPVASLSRSVHSGRTFLPTTSLQTAYYVARLQDLEVPEAAGDRSAPHVLCARPSGKPHYELPGGDLVEEAVWGGRVLGRPVDLLSGPVSVSAGPQSGNAGLGNQHTPCLSVESPQPSPSTQRSPPGLSPQGPAVQGPNPLLGPVLSDAAGAGMDDREEPKRKCVPTDEAYFIAKEILATERTYLKDLEVITVWFRSAVVKADAMPADLMTLLFSNIDPIYEFHRGFLREVEQRLALWVPTVPFLSFLRVSGPTLALPGSPVRSLSAVFLELKPPLKCHKLVGGGFCPRHPSPLAPACTEGPLHADALQAITEVTSMLQHSLVQLENLQKLTELQRDLVGIESLVAPGRELIREGCLHKLSRKGLQQRMFFLFSDMLLYTSRDAGGSSHFRIRGLLPLHGMLVEDQESEWSVPHCFTIYAAQKTIMVAASTRLEKAKWLHDLNAAIDAAKTGSALVPPARVLCPLPRGSPNEASLEPESEDEAGGARGSVAGTGRHRASTAAHVCWCRQSSVSRADHSAAVENQLSGYLLRKFKNSSGWQKLWVVFTNFCLFFYKTHQAGPPVRLGDVGGPGTEASLVPPSPHFCKVDSKPH
ncbi:PREDICTED: FERM, RhoGEF and pleckstrin domain-containing protein 2 [Bison bison bison]|uniref:FERM, RhoGEF and pleckstrin domain-containing protein 2 n=1 Tax=Bison bison bison TaxID=43346 RepID=A0A6P3GWD0_BISBB|nr:PREDICTED: FERM, RhoGEF and pleckstrin domain-containing protein 2 [Bison bison bison]